MAVCLCNYGYKQQTEPKGHKPERLSSPDRVTGSATVPADSGEGKEDEMKTALKNTLTAARRHWLRFQMNSLTAHIDGCDECLYCVRDPLLAMRIRVSRNISCRELARLRAEYNATLPPGKRAVWGWA